MPEYNTRKTTENPIYMFTVCGLAHTVLSKTSKAALLSFLWTGTASTDHTIWSAERDISSAGYASACGRQRVASALQPALLLGWVTGWGRRMAGCSGRWHVDSMRYASLRCHYLFGLAACRRTSPSRECGIVDPLWCNVFRELFTGTLSSKA